jgi:hypothetical protein
MTNVPATPNGLGLLAARAPLYMGIALLAMAVRHRTVLAAFPMLPPRMVRP